MNVCPCCGYTENKRQSIEQIAATAGLSRLQRKAFDHYAAHFGKLVLTPDVIKAVYDDEPDGGPVNVDQCLTVLVRKTRKRIEPFGLTIESSQGYAGRRLMWVGEDS